MSLLLLGVSLGVALPALASPAEPATAAACQPNEWLGQYYNSTDQTGVLVGERCDAEIGFDYGQAGPGVPGVGSDFFSVRWSRTITAATDGGYRFRALSDDGFRVYVDGELVLDKYFYNGDLHTVDVPMSAGPHDLVVEYYEYTGPAYAYLTMRPLLPATCAADEWEAEYVARRNPSRTSRDCLAQVAVNWGAGGPAGVGNDYFQTLLTRTYRSAGTYSITVRSDDGIRVWAGDILVVDRWFDQAGNDVVTASVTLPRGPHEFRVEHYENRGGALLFVDVTPPPDPVPGAPMALTSANVADGVALAWDPPVDTDVAGYRVYRGASSPVSTDQEPLSGTSLVTRRSFTDASVVPGTDYQYAVVAVDDAGQVSGTTEIGASVPVAPDVLSPDPVVGLLVDATAAGLVVTWEPGAAADVVGYRVFRSTSLPVPTAGTGLGGELPASTTAFTDTDARRGLTYRYAVLAVDASGNVSVPVTSTAVSRAIVRPQPDLPQPRPDTNVLAPAPVATSAPTQLTPTTAPTVTSTATVRAAERVTTATHTAATHTAPTHTAATHTAAPSAAGPSPAAVRQAGVPGPALPDVTVTARPVPEPSGPAFPVVTTTGATDLSAAAVAAPGQAGIPLSVLVAALVAENLLLLAGYLTYRARRGGAGRHTDGDATA